MFANYKHKLGIGCILCKHMWYILTNDDEISEDFQKQWARDIVKEHNTIHEEEGYEE